MIREPLGRAWRAWGGARGVAAARVCLLAATALLGLSAAGTLEVTFTLQPSYVLLALAVAVGLPEAARGWRMMPRPVAAAAVALVGIYVLAAALGDPARLSSQSRGGEVREAVYLMDLLLGLGVVGVLTALWSLEFGRSLLRVAVLGGAVTAAYATYQWVALRYGLPLADVNNAPNSDGFTRGRRHQGLGLFGWERTRGTFKEPLYLGVFCATMVPLALLVAVEARGWRRVVWTAALIVIGTALVLTSSSLSWGIVFLVAVGVGLLVGLRDGHPAIAGVLASAAAITVLAGPSLLLDPSTLASATGRTKEQLQLTSQNRQAAWDKALRVWAGRPILGYGPGQSSVRLAYRPEIGIPGAPVVLGSAQGIGTASLVDAGLAGLAAWIALLGGLLAFVVRAAWRTQGFLVPAVAAAAGAAVIAAYLSGDRLDFRAWLLIAFAAAASHLGGDQAGDTHGEPREASSQR